MKNGNSSPTLTIIARPFYKKKKREREMDRILYTELKNCEILRVRGKKASCRSYSTTDLEMEMKTKSEKKVNNWQHHLPPGNRDGKKCLRFKDLNYVNMFSIQN